MSGRASGNLPRHQNDSWNSHYRNSIVTSRFRVVSMAQPIPIHSCSQYRAIWDVGPPPLASLCLFPTCVVPTPKKKIVLIQQKYLPRTFRPSNCRHSNSFLFNSRSPPTHIYGKATPPPGVHEANE